MVENMSQKRKKRKSNSEETNDWDLGQQEYKKGKK